VLEWLDNVVWNALSGSQAHLSAGTSAARRYARGFSPIAGFAHSMHPALGELRAYCDIGEHLYCTDWTGEAPADWHIEAEDIVVTMVWQGEDVAPPKAGVVKLGREHAAQALALATLTQPGPFGPRTTEMGDYFGIFEDGALIAMAGERMQVETLREISGVCTHPAHQGRGLARTLIGVLLNRQLGRGATPFLHVMRGNTLAHAFYRRIGFGDYRERVVRVISPR